MALGRLDEAIRRYGEAERVAATVSAHPELELARLGLALALDRDGQAERSAALVGQVLDADPALAELSSPSVFFQPPEDLYAYLALGWEGAARRFGAAVDRANAQAAWRRYLDAAPLGPYAARARAHLEALSSLRPSATGRVAAVGDRSNIDGPSVERPVLTILGGGLSDAPGERSAEALEALLGREVERVALCPARHPPRPRGRPSVTVGLLIGDGGWIQAQPLDSEGTSPQLDRCIEQQLRHWRLPPMDAPPGRKPTAALVRVQLGTRR
jgi:tetratricopeptide (TPR) repeat protein